MSRRSTYQSRLVWHRERVAFVAGTAFGVAITALIVLFFEALP